MEDHISSTLVLTDKVIRIMEDLNVKVGDERYQYIVGVHGLGRKNERGERLIQFCQENKLINNQLENYTQGKFLETYQEIKRLHHV